MKHRVSVAASYSPAPPTPSSEEKDLMDVGSASGGGGGRLAPDHFAAAGFEVGRHGEREPQLVGEEGLRGQLAETHAHALQPLSPGIGTARSPPCSATLQFSFFAAAAAAAAAAASSMDDKDEEAEDDDKDVEEKGEGGEETAEEEVEETEEEEKKDTEGTAAAVTAAADAPSSVVVVVVAVDGGRIHSSVRHSPTRKRMRKGVRNPSSSMLSLLFCSSWK